MADTQTPNYGWIQPQIGGDPTTWGNLLNNNTALIDAQVFKNEQGVPPVGTVVMFAGPNAPPNWLLCQGQSLDTTAYNTLFSIIGYTWGGSGANFNLPNLGASFPCGTGTNPEGVGVGLGEYTGSFSVSIPYGSMPAHEHNVPDPEHYHTISEGGAGHTHGASQAAHSHVIATGGHSHGVHTGAHAHSYTYWGVTGGGQSVRGDIPSYFQGSIGGTTSTVGDLGGSTDAAGNLGGNTDTQAPGVTIGYAVTGITNTDWGATRISTTDVQGSSAPMSVVPPLVGINFIIRYI